MRHKLLIMLGGPTMNLLIALVLFGGLLVTYGVPQATTTLGLVQQCVVAATEQRTQCAPGDPLSPAAKAGLRPGDRIVAVDGRPTPEWDDVRAAIRPAAGRTLTFTIVRDGREQQVQVTPVPNVVRRDETSDELITVGFLGVSPTAHRVPLPVAEVPGELWSYVEQTFAAVLRVPQRMVGVWRAAFGDGERDPNGPIGIVGVSRLGGEVVELEEIGLVDKAAGFVSLVAGLNLALFVFNLIPLLPLDGGHVAGALYEGARRQVARVRRQPDPGPADVARMLPLAYTVATVLIAMSLLLIYADIVNPVRLSQ